MKNSTTLLIAGLLIAAVTACNPANHPPPATTVAQSDTIILRSQNGYYHAASGSYINMFNVMQLSHSTVTDSGFCMVRLDSVLDATNYHMNMQLAGVQHNNGRFDVQVNCLLALAPVTDTTKDSSVMFIAQCSNGKNMSFDTVMMKKNDKSFTLHIDNATANYYYIVLWNLYPVRNSTVSFQDIMIMKAK